MSVVSASLLGGDDAATTVPERLLGVRLWWRGLRFWCYRWRRTWRTGLAANFVYPVVYLAAMGLGLGQLVDHHLHATGGNAALGGVSYLLFVTPGILGGSMMQIAVNETTYPVMGGLRWDRAYFVQLATPLRVADIVAGHLGYLAVRVLMASSVFLAIAAAFGALGAPSAALAVPVSLLAALAFGCPVAAFSVTRENDGAFAAMYRLGVVPLFLFSGSFFPIRELPGALQAVALATPLYHAVALERACTLGRFTIADVAHAGYLLGLALAGFLVARVTYRRRLTP